MKIGQQSDPSPATTQSSQPASARAGQRGVGAAPAIERRSPTGANVTVSNLALRMERTRASDAPDVDIDKVNAVRQAIEQKTFVVNPGVIADKMLANAREMLNRTRS